MSHKSFKSSRVKEDAHKVVRVSVGEGHELERKTKAVSGETGEKAGKSAACDLHLFAC